jgi:hypothetical protein
MTSTSTSTRRAPQIDRRFQGEFRPLVAAAWSNHAGLMGESVSDRAAHDAWYRDNLYAAARITTTKGASPHALKQCLAWFARLSERQPPKPLKSAIPVAGWSAAQRYSFTRLAVDAHGCAVALDESSAGEMLDWLAARMAEVFPHVPVDQAGVFHLGTCTAGFDAAMGCLAAIARDRVWMDRTARGSATRLRWQLNRFLLDLAWLEGKPVAWPYVRGIMQQADLPEDETACTAPQMAAVLSMLDTHVRRLCGRAGPIRPCMLPSRPPADPQLLAEWRYYHAPTPGHTRRPDGSLIQAAAP